MKDLKNIKIKDERKSNKSHTALAAATGIAIGAGATALVVKSLSDKKNRAKLSKTFSDVKSQVSDSMDAMVSSARKKGKLEGKVVKKKIKIKKIAKPRASTKKK